MAIITTTSTIYSNFKRNNSSTKIVGMSTVLGVSLLLHHDMAMIAPSDSQLAICSLVCTVWRRAAVEGVVRCAMNGVLAAINPTATLDNAGEGGGENIGRTDFNLVQGLLITEMAKMLVLQRIQNTRENQHQDGGDHKPNYAIVNNHQQNKQGPFCLAWFEPSGIQMTSIVMKGHRDEEDRRTKYPRIVQECCHEWRGYRTPWEVLRPFGYDDNFVSEVFIATLQEAAERELISESESDWHETACQESAASYDHIPTFAVRGATLARPEGHCLCLDEEYIRHHEAIARTRPPPLSQRHRMPQTIHDVTSRFNSRTVDLLPTVVVNDDQRSGIRFCSADASHVTRLITPFFNCGGVEGPVTMFLVVSSDDESCWVSGRNSRFEVGHRFTSHGEAHTVTLVGNQHGGSSWSDDDDDDYDTPFQCLCLFQSDDPFRAKHLSEEAPSEDRIFRGCLTTVERSEVGCYCVVFDGKQSMIRVNTKEDTQKRVSRVGNLWREIRYDPERNGMMVGSGVLNGLSLGADHQFDHSLSNDLYGSDTVLYELAVFSGRMIIGDIQKMEHHLMQKHGIVAQQ